jgi:hypothetical protein
MKRLEYLITQVRNSTDNKDVNGVSTAEIVSYFNDAQSYITTLIFKNNPYADLFKVQVELPAVSSGEYILPDDCYSTNALSMVEARFADTSNNKGYSRIKPIMESEFSYIFGYITRDNKVLISGQNDVAQLQNVRITYFKQLPTLDIRRGQIVAPFTTTSFSVSGLDSEVFTMNDMFSVVGQTGDQGAKGIYSTSTSSPMTTSAAKVTEIIAAGSTYSSVYLVSGANACNKSQLPDVCETYLLDYVRQRIYTRNNYDDASKQMYFTEQRQAEILSIFSKNKKDDDTIPVTDVEFLFF